MPNAAPMPTPRPSIESSGNEQQHNIIVNTDLNSLNSATESQPNEEPIHTTIPERSNQDQQEAIKRSDSTETEFSQPWDESLSTSLDSKISNLPSYKSESSNKEDNSYTAFDSLIPSSKTKTKLQKLKAKLGYPMQQRAFVIFSTALVTFLAAYTGLMSKHLKSISNLNNPSLYIPIIVASVLAALSIVAFIWNLKDTRIKKTSTKDGSETFSIMEGLVKKKDLNGKHIKSIELKLSNNTNYIFLDSDKYKYKTPVFKKLELTLKRSLINVEIAAFVTITATYLVTKYFEIGYENLVNSLKNFNTGNAELMAFTITAGVILALFMCSFIHYYRKTYVEKLEIVTDHKEIVSSDNGIKSYNEKYVEKVKAHYKDKDSWSSGKHNLHKAASLTIDQAEIECYNGKTVIIAAA